MMRVGGILLKSPEQQKYKNMSILPGNAWALIKDPVGFYRETEKIWANGRLEHGPRTGKGIF